ncbi:uncharacterized protein LOC117241283 [Bombus vosnesenskii]|uniref:Uncharacterized protein LOC117241283 n=1 Tax=Bombus vosnesenskii TaxID=207650 RepID=A0A6J3LEN6_9HYME|nr:uncharacterized protein LOC117241283 [Bombus vosnesenskii]
MDTGSKKEIKEMITKDISNIHNYSLDVKKYINNQLEDTLDYLHGLIAEIPQSVPGPSTTKRPKVLKKKGYRRKETIPENDIINTDNTVTDSAVHDKTENKDVKTGDVLETTIDRTKRKAAIKAAINIKKQQSVSLVTKLRRLTPDDDSNRKRGGRPKKKESARSSSDEKNTKGPTKHSKTKKNVLSETISKEDAIQPERIEPLKSSMTTRDSNIKRTFSRSENTKGKYSNIIDDRVIPSARNDIEDPSICEDALEKFTPLMNSTMDINSTYTQKMMDATAIVEPLLPIKSNETVVINKNLASSIGKNNEPKFTSRSPITLQEEVQQLNQAIGLTELEELFAEGEMSNRNMTKQDIQNEMKKNVPVRRRIEAFEKEKISEKAIVQKLARRSVEKAKKILLAKQKKETQMMTSQVTLQTVSKYSSVIKTQAIIHSIFYPKYSSKQ